MDAIVTVRTTSAAAEVVSTDAAEVVIVDTSAAMAYPPSKLAAAKQAVRLLRADGGTAMGRWLALADDLFAGHEGGPRHAILLTDGENQHESPRQLTKVLDEVAGRFTCDCRGVGTDWQVAELRRIAEAMLGTVDIVADPDGLAEDFRSMAATAMGKAVAGAVGAADGRLPGSL